MGRDGIGSQWRGWGGETGWDFGVVVGRLLLCIGDG